ncbi:MULTISPECIES: lysophospholipid acyltransferase family protein [unclassified Streptomyces]|uniref:lysophospholipid acyltransferase family protein n=1 Tax=unclassified Streptomyces TaxID=2593676 RepID=UPI0036F8871B
MTAPDDTRAPPLPTAWARSAPARGLRTAVHRALLTPYVWACARPTVEGAEHLVPLTAPVVFVANHSSHLDTPLLFGALPPHIASRLVVGAAADYFFGSPLTGAATALVFNAFPVQRGAAPGRTGRDGRGRAVRGAARRLLEEGWHVLLFPEGTRSRDGRLGAFGTGAARLCLQTSASAVPVALVGTHAVLPRGTRVPVRGAPPVSVRFGRPIRAVPGEGPPDFRDRMRESVRTLQRSP